MNNYNMNPYAYGQMMPGAYAYSAWAPEEQKAPSNVPPPPQATQSPIRSSTIVKDLMDIIKKGNVGEIKNFIGEFGGTVETRNLDVTKVTDGEFRHTCLFYAALIKDTDAYFSLYCRAFQVMKFLIDLHVPVNYKDTLKQTVLYYVARENQMKCVDMLLELGNIIIMLKDVM